MQYLCGMENSEQPTPEDQSSLSDKMLDGAAGNINKWKRATTINSDDHFLVVVLKIGIRIIGILILIAISPFALLGLILGVLAAG